jgi:hypothetical protein
MRYAIMMRRSGQGFGNMPYARQRREPGEQRHAAGLNFNLFATGGDY